LRSTRRSSASVGQQDRWQKIKQKYKKMSLYKDVLVAPTGEAIAYHHRCGRVAAQEIQGCAAFYSKIYFVDFKIKKKGK
jgi:hypothetical protein